MDALQKSLSENFPVDEALRRVREAVRPYPAASLFVLAEEGHGTLFEILVACVISVRTLEEDTLTASRRLFARARTPATVGELSVETIAELIPESSFAEKKAQQIAEIARRARHEHNGDLPADRETLLQLPGIGPKCAALGLGIAGGGTKTVPVDIHVHRVTNRWGSVATTTPEKTVAVLSEKLPENDRLEINRLLVPFGKYICTGTLPRCSDCVLRDLCPRIGVTRHR